MNVTEEFPKMLFDHEDALKQFKRDTYEDLFREYLALYRPLFEQIETEYLRAGDGDAYLNDLADSFVLKAKEACDAIPKKSRRTAFVVDHNSVMVIYVMPAIQEYHMTCSGPLLDALLTKWNAAFPQYQMRAGTFSDINSGFRRKLCYVTTAVCSSLGKDEDCYELRLLKDYRDGYLSEQPDGEELIREYYDIAPTIVNRINRSEQAREVYEQIYTDYIRPCISLIEEKKEEQCKEMYVQMMRVLQNKYLYNAV